jgi:hypothetical protein
LNSNTELVLVLVIGVGLAGCGANNPSTSDGLPSLPDGAAAGAEAG